MPNRCDPIEVVTIPLTLFDDLIAMARRSIQYRRGDAWTAVAMNRASRIKNAAAYRIAARSDET